MLVVEDEENCREMYRNWLGDDYEVRTAASGRAGLSKLDASVDVVLLDREMAGISGTKTARAIRAREIDCHVVMVTGVEPEPGMADLPIDDYLTKPIRGRELHSVIERMIARSTFREEMQELFALSAKKATLETECHPAKLLASEEYAELRRRIRETRERLTAALETAEMDWDETFESFAVREADPEPETNPSVSV